MCGILKELVLCSSPSRYLNHIVCFQVSRHLTKLFDSMAQLKFTQDDGGNDTKIAISMYSKDGEVVELDKPCDLAGQVWIYR